MSTYKAKAKGRGVPIPASQTHLNQDKEGLNPASPPNSQVAGLAPRGGEKDQRIHPAQMAPALLHELTPKHWDVLLWGHLNQALLHAGCFSLFWPKLFTRFNRDVKLWAASTKQHFLANTLVWKTIPVAQQKIFFSKASYWVGVKGALRQKKRHHTPSSPHPASICYIDTESTKTNGEM